MTVPTKAIKQVLVFRTDIQMNKGKMIAQGAHASNKVCLKTNAAGEHDNEYMCWWKWNDGSRKIALQVPTLAELEELEKKAAEAGLTVYSVIDSAKAGLEIKDVPVKTCIAIGPNFEEDIDKITGHLKTI